jgi:hypothetical protein
MYSPSSRVTRGSSTPNSSYAAKGPSRSGVRNGCGSAEKRNPSAAGQANNGPSGAEMRTEKHDVFAPVLHNRRVVNSLHGIGDLGGRQSQYNATDGTRSHARQYSDTLKAGPGGAVKLSDESRRVPWPETTGPHSTAHEFPTRTFKPSGRKSSTGAPRGQ